MKVKELSHCGGTNSWFTIQYKGKSAGKVHLETKWLQYSFKEQEETKEALIGKGWTANEDQIPENGYIKMMLR